MEKEVFECVIKFMVDNGISCEDTIHQCDRVIENAYEFMADLYKIVESKLPSEEED